MRLVVVTSIIFASLLVSSWLVTDSSWDFFPPDFLGYYENHGAHLLEGRLDVDYSAIRWESLQKNGKDYGYFGPVPALARIALTSASPAHAYHWTAVSILSGILWTLLCCWLLINSTLNTLLTLSPKERLVLEGILLANAGLGSTLLTLCSPSMIYHEAIVWGNAFVLATAVALIRYFDRFRLRYALLAAGLGGLAIQTRTSVGFGSVIMMLVAFAALLLLPECSTSASIAKCSKWLGLHEAPRLTRRHLLLLLLVLVIAATPFALSWAKFGELSLMPYNYRIDESPEHLMRANGSIFHLGNTLFNLKHYLNPFGVSAANVFPYINLAPKDWGWRNLPDIRFLRGEPFMPVTISMTLWILLSLAGVYGIIKGLPTLRIRIAPMIGALMGGAVIFPCVFIMNRYTHDLFPFLLIAGTAGIAWLDRISATRRRVLYAAAVVLTLFAIYANGAVCLLNMFAGPQISEKLLLARTRLDGDRISVPVMDVADSQTRRGITQAAQQGWGVILSDQIPLGLTIGAHVNFAASGARTVTDFKEMKNYFILFVDGPLDPDRDGAPALLSYRRLPCATVDCGAPRFDD